MKKRYIVCAIFLLIPGLFIFSEQLSKIGIIDLSKIASQYFKESRAYRELETMIEKYEDEKNRILEDISQLETRKIDAENEGNDILSLRLENEIYNKKEYLKEYNLIKYTQIKNKREKLSESEEFIKDIMREIDYIAESEGYSVIMKSSDPNIIWWNSEVDITDLVLERLMQRAAAAKN